MCNIFCVPFIFKTRRITRMFINHNWGYIRDRKDLQAEPYGWKMPIPVRVKVEMMEGKK
jgi:hypothetical protein